MSLPRGIRNNNPGNLRHGSPWQGLVHAVKDPSFCQFTLPVYGIRAIAVTLSTYHRKRLADDGSPIDTLFEAISRWAPSFENHTLAYADYVAHVLSDVLGDTVRIHDRLDLTDFDVMFGVVSGIVRYENGNGEVRSLNSWYADSLVEKALEMAGIVNVHGRKTHEMVSVKRGME